MAMQFIPDEVLQAFLRRSVGTPTIVPAETRRLSWLDDSADSAVSDVLRRPRAAQSAKGFFLPAAESMGCYGPSGAAATAVETARQVLVGVRACELRARNYLDAVMLKGNFTDPAYQARRDGTMLVSCDCVDCTESCFCTLVGGLPFAEEGFDVNLSPIEGGFLAEAATDRGAQWLGEVKGASRATDEQVARRDALRQEMVERLNRQNARFEFAASDEKPLRLPDESDSAWQGFAADCVECGACTNICPTCHCFYLYDQAVTREQFERIRTWDSCLFSSYHRMAGGTGMKLSPRPMLFNRLANRVLHKFTYSHEQYGLVGCVGCGRCVDACVGEIDIRQVVADLALPSPSPGESQESGQ